MKNVFKIYNSTFPATKTEDHKPNQVREKYAEMQDSSGGIKLLLTHPLIQRFLWSSLKMG